MVSPLARSMQHTKLNKPHYSLMCYINPAKKGAAPFVEAIETFIIQVHILRKTHKIFCVLRDSCFSISWAELGSEKQKSCDILFNYVIIFFLVWNN